MRAQFAERTDSVVLEKAEAERRLAAVEAEMRRLTENLKEACERHTEEMKKQEERVCAYPTRPYKSHAHENHNIETENF